MCFLIDFSIEKKHLSQTLKVEAVDLPIFFSKPLTPGHAHSSVAELVVELKVWDLATGKHFRCFYANLVMR